MTLENRINISNVNWKGPPSQSLKEKNHHTGGETGEKNLLLAWLGETHHWRPSLVARWLRVSGPTQGTRVPSLLQEDPPRVGATKPACPNYRACALQPGAMTTETHTPQSGRSATRRVTATRSHAPQCQRSPARHPWRRPTHSHGDSAQSDIQGCTYPKTALLKGRAPMGLSWPVWLSRLGPDTHSKVRLSSPLSKLPRFTDFTNSDRSASRGPVLGKPTPCHMGPRPAAVQKPSLQPRQGLGLILWLAEGLGQTQGQDLRPPGPDG